MTSLKAYISTFPFRLLAATQWWSPSITRSSFKYWVLARHAVAGIKSSPLAEPRVGEKAKFLDHDFGNLHTWPPSNYLIQPCKGVGGRRRLRLSTGCAGAGAGAKSIIWWRKSEVSPSALYSMLPTALLVLLRLQDPFGSFLTQLCFVLRFPNITKHLQLCSTQTPASPNYVRHHPPYAPTYCWILVLGLTKR